MFDFLKRILSKRKSKNLTINKSSFGPVRSLEDKNNFKRYYRIERDGSVKERIFLNVPDVSLREQIICLHYIQFCLNNFTDEKELVGIKFVKRDEPWDFDVELSNGQRFNVEITSIADNI